jgi:hypothetical protein
LEQSRLTLERSGLPIAAISYDSREVLHAFAEKHGIGFPLLSDRDSAVIRSFGILNTNVAPGLRAHGVPHPVDYLVAPNGVLVRKYFVPNYQHRVTASQVVLREIGAIGAGVAAVTLQSGALTVEIGFSGANAFAGQEIGFFAKFKLEPGWHVYGTPLPTVYTATSIAFDDPGIVRQSFDLPEARPMKVSWLDETLPVYDGSFQEMGSLLLRFPFEAGGAEFAGKLRFQQCSDSVCEAPETISFDLPLTIEPFVVAQPKK